MQTIASFHLEAALVAGLAGTIAMTLLMKMAPLMGVPKMSIVSTLGTMILEDEKLSLGVGSALHLMMGLAFALVYALLWSLGIGQPVLLWGLAFGAAHAMIAAMGMPLMLGMHPRKPEMPKGMAAMLGMLAGHMLFGVVVATVYAAAIPHLA